MGGRPELGGSSNFDRPLSRKELPLHRMYSRLPSGLDLEGEFLELDRQVDIDDRDSRGQPQHRRCEIQDASHPRCGQRLAHFLGCFPGYRDNPQLGSECFNSPAEIADRLDRQTLDPLAHLARIGIEKPDQAEPAASVNPR